MPFWQDIFLISRYFQRFFDLGSKVVYGGGKNQPQQENTWKIKTMKAH
jgi:hypothetical protein